MRTYIKSITLTLACVLAFATCDDRLDLSPIGELNSENFYNNEEDFEAASLAPYSTLLNLYFDQSGGGWFQPIMYPGDDVRNELGNNDIEEFNWLSTNGNFRNVWDESYKGIMRSNVVIAQLEDADGFSDESNKARFEGEAKFIRAYFYFILARNFGEVPVIDEVLTTIEDTRIGNSQTGEVWDLIESDLAFAAENLPESWDDDNTGRATRYAASALLGKAQIYRAQWLGEAGKYQDAITNLQAVVNSGQYSLMDDYGDNFSEDAENNAESIFEIQMTRGDFNPWLPADHVSNEGAAGTGRRIFTAAGCNQGDRKSVV